MKQDFEMQERKVRHAATKTEGGAGSPGGEAERPLFPAVPVGLAGGSLLCYDAGAVPVWRNYIDSDMASDMVWRNCSTRKAGVLSTQWWYSTELNVFCEQLVYRLGLALFPGDWYAARMVGQAFLLLLLILSYLYVGHGLRLKNCGAWGAAALACPFGVWYWWYGPFGGFYFPYMILLLLGFGSMLHLLRPAGKPPHPAMGVSASGNGGPPD